MRPEISILVKYFKAELPKLKNTYNWRIPEIEGFPKNRERAYKANIELKEFLHEQWNLTRNEKEKNDLARVVISGWGGVKNNKNETIKKYVKGIQGNDPHLPIKGVASYSKLFSIVYPEKYAIYDARVAVCLNAVQFNGDIRKGIAFNYVPGRNNTTGHAGKRIGFSYDKRFVVKNLAKCGWAKIKRDDTYSVYLATLRDCLRLLPSYKLRDLEMTLFSNAEVECSKAMNSPIA